MNTLFRSIFIGGALAILLVGCQKKEESAAAPAVQPSPAVTTATAPIPGASIPDPSLPNAAGKAAGIQGTQDTTALQHKADPQGKMSKEEESKAMPLPGQANDHSTTAVDKRKNK